MKISLTVKLYATHWVAEGAGAREPHIFTDWIRLNIPILQENRFIDHHYLATRSSLT